MEFGQQMEGVLQQRRTRGQRDQQWKKEHRGDEANSKPKRKWRAGKFNSKNSGAMVTEGLS